MRTAGMDMPAPLLLPLPVGESKLGRDRPIRLVYSPVGLPGPEGGLNPCALSAKGLRWPGLMALQQRSLLSQHTWYTGCSPVRASAETRKQACKHCAAVPVFGRESEAGTHLGVLVAAVICSRGTARLISIGLSCSDWMAPCVKTCARVDGSVVLRWQGSEAVTGRRLWSSSGQAQLASFVRASPASAEVGGGPAPQRPRW